MDLVLVVGLQNQTGILQPSADFFPNPFVQHIGADTTLRTAFLFQESAGGAQTRVVMAGLDLTFVDLFTGIG